MIQWNKSLYTRVNKITQIMVNHVNNLARIHFPQEYESEWGCKITLKQKALYLNEVLTYYGQDHLMIDMWPQSSEPVT